MNRNKYFLISLALILLTSCASQTKEPVQAGNSYLQGKENILNVEAASETLDEVQANNAGFNYLTQYNSDVSPSEKSKDLVKNFSDTEMVRIAADDLPLKEFLHYVFGELLGGSYILGDEAQKDNSGITLNINDQISKRKLFELAEELLFQRKYVIRFDDGIYYIHKAEGAGAQGDIAYGYGSVRNDVPNTSLDIVQMVALIYGLPTSLAQTLRTLTKVQASPDFERNAILLQGKRRDILRGLEFVNLMDQPKFQGRHIGSYQTNFISVDELIENLTKLLKQEGISFSAGEQNDAAISVVALDRITTMVIFANDAKLIERVAYWAEQLDKPASGSELQYFVFHPNFSRASDLGESILQLLSGQSSQPLSNSTSAAQQNQDSKTTQAKKVSFSSEDMSLVVDSRSNSLIFHTTGEQYKKIHPLIKRLDVLPKQVMLEVMIAEVTLTDEFKQGVEFAFSDGNYGLSTKGAFFGDGFGGLSYLLQGAKGQVALNLFQSNSLVDIISRPSLVVRDGVQANISVGTDIPVVGQTTGDPINSDRQTTSIEYRKTGVELEVTPTVNAQGFVIMEINQKISTETDSGGTTVGGNPALFERSIKTEVVAESGQTVVLGGLISENRSNKDTKVPFFGDLPLLGDLFKAKTKKGDKTELVVLVTPRIIESAEEWEDIKSKFSNELKKITIF
jgi:general secretion pathway protein D